MKILRLAAGLALLGLVASAGAQQAARKPYIVKLTAAPAATYAGGIAGYGATAPAPGNKLDAASQQVRNYLSYLDGEVGKVTATVPSAKVLHRYGATIAGFAAMLTDAEVAKLRTNPAVEMIQEDKAEPMDTSFTTSTFLGLGAPGGVWSQLDASGRAIKGEGVVIGIIDGGIWPENPSFSDRVDGSGKPVPGNVAGGTVVYDPLPGTKWRGSCVVGEGFPAGSCNNKLVGARFYDASWRAFGPPFLPFEFVNSPRDSNGHGSHTAGTAGGNADAAYTVGGANFSLTGVAPRARIAAYKTCWSAVQPDGSINGSCFSGDRQAAIDQAVLDGVDVLNHSIGLGGTSVTDVVSVSMLNASRAGVFVAGSGGNSGPANAVNASAPWITTVAATTHSRTFESTITLGSGAQVTGPSWQTAGLPAGTGLVLSTNAGVTPYANLTSDADRLALARCYNAADRADPALNPAGLPTAASLIDPAKVAGKIVVCYRGGNTFVNKISATAGAAGMVFQNIPAGSIFASANTTFANIQVIPTVHLPASTAATVLTYGEVASPTAAMAPRVQNPNGAVAPQMASFSSRGPNLFDVNVLKPDIAAPGVDIIAAYVPETFDTAMRNSIVNGGAVPLGASMISGTSMASPHVAGAAALLKQAKPGWSPAAIKSALMTSSNNVLLANGAVDTNRFGFGAGHLAPNAALGTSLVYDITGSQFVSYATRALSGTALNQASLTHGNVLGAATLTRTLTNKGSASVTLTPTITLPAGFSATVTPATLTVAPGASASYQLRVTRTTAAFGSYLFGDITWAGGGQVLKSPLTLRASGIVATTSVTDTRAVGTRLHTVGTGFTGTLNQRPLGLVPSTRTSGTLTLDDEQCATVDVPTGTLSLRAQLFNVDTEGGALTDLDLTIYNAAGSVVASSGGGTSDELATLTNPAAGRYFACAYGFGLAPGLATANYTISTWVLNPASNPNNLTVAGGASVTLGGLATLGAAWNVPADNRYLGIVRYSDSPTGPVVGSTTFLIDPLSATLSNPPVATLVKDKTVR